MKLTRLHMVMLAAMFASAALVGCKKDAPAPLPPLADSMPAPAPAPATMAATAAVNSVDLGNAVGADMRVTAPMASFAPNDTIYAAISTGTSDPAASVAGKLGAKWSYIGADGTLATVKEESKDLTMAGDGVSNFQISKPDGWPTGNYKVEVMLDGNVVQTREFAVK